MMKTMRCLLGSLAVAAFPLSAWAGIHVQQNDPYLNIGSMTATGGGGVNVTYGVVAATFTGNGSALTGVTVGLPLPAGATNYINAGSLPTGATFYVSSGTVTGQFSPATIKWPDGTIQTSSPPVSSVLLTASQTFTGANTFSTPGPSTFTYGLTVGSVTLTNVAAGIQCLHANGTGQVTGSGSDCASTAGFVSLTATQTVSGGNTFVTPGQSTFTYGIVTGSITITGSGAGGWQFTEGYDTSTFSPTATKDNLWASISSHSLVTNYNASTATGTIVVSTFNIGAGHYLTSSALGQIGDGGATSVVAQGSQGNIQWNNSGLLAGSTNTIVTASSITIFSSVTINTGGGNNAIPSLLNIFDGHSYDGKALFEVGSQNHLDFYVQDGQALTDNFGYVANNVVMGAVAFPDSIYDTQAILNQIILSSGNSSGSGVSGEMDIETDNNKGQPIVLLPGLVKTMTISSETVTISTRTSIVSTTNGLYALTVSTTTSNYQIAITTTGHVSSYGVLPSTSSCGTGAGFTGTDFTGIITPGTAASGCTVTFSKPYKNTPSCIVEEQTLSLVNALSWTVSTTALVISQTSLTSKVNYICTGINE